MQLIPLYAIGVFLSFSLSQGGMARCWWKSGQTATFLRLCLLFIPGVIVVDAPCQVD